MANTYTSLHYHLVFSTKNRERWISPDIEEGGSSAWIHDAFPALKGFAWQDGYGAFSVSKSAMPEVADYIRSQREHHRTRSFQEEYLTFLRKHEVDYDERYLWD